MKVELILEGGGMRGIYTCGVLDFFLEKKIVFENVIGVSAGSINALSYISGQKKRQHDIFINYSHNKEYISFSNYLKTGSAFGFDYLFNQLFEKELPFDYQTFKNSRSKLLVVITNLKSGQAEYVPIVDLKKQTDYIRASCSLPLISNIVQIGEEAYMDGGMADSIPIKSSFERGFNKQIVILTRSKDYQKGKDKLIGIKKIKYKDYPNYIETLSNRSKKYNETLAYINKLEEENRIIVIRPSEPMKIDKFETDKEKLEYYYQLGYKDGLAQYQQIKQYLFDCTNAYIK